MVIVIINILYWKHLCKLAFYVNIFSLYIYCLMEKDSKTDNNS